MEDIIYEKTYIKNMDMEDTVGGELEDSIGDELLQGDFLASLSREFDKVPKAIVKENKANYEDLLSRLDKKVEAWGGKIKGVVSYKLWDSNISIEQPFIEFTTDESLILLGDIAKHSSSVTFTATPEGNVRMLIYIDYFITLMSNEEMGDIIGEELKKHPKLLGLLEERRRLHGEEPLYSDEDKKQDE